MTTTTPASRAAIAYVAYHRTLAGPGKPITAPAFGELPLGDRASWSTAAEIVWGKAKTGRGRGDVLDSSPRPSGLALDASAWTSAAGVLWDLAVTGHASI